ncbi:MAG: glycosyltransferase family 9 protein [Pseudodesulfovibrio sp.]
MTVTREHGVFVLPERDLGEPESLFLEQCGPLDGPILCHERNRETAARLCGHVETFGGGNLAPCRADLDDLARRVGAPSASARVILSGGPVPPHILTALRLMGFARAARLGGNGGESPLPPAPDPSRVRSVLVKVNGGIGNVVLFSFLASAAAAQGWETWFCPTVDRSNAYLGDLFEGGLPRGVRLVRPEGLAALRPDLCLNVEDHANRAEGDLFHAPYRVGAEGHGPTFAARFYRNATGHEADPSRTFVGGDPALVAPELRGRVVVCPGSKPGWDSKRWPHMNALLRRLDRPVVVCRPEDLSAYAELEFLHPITAPGATVLTDLSLAGLAGLFRAARSVVANDCGPAHVAAAAGAPTLMLFGPSSLTRNRHLRQNVRSLSLGLDCQPCQGAESGPGRLAPHDYRCDLGYRCLADLSVERVTDELRLLESGR